MKNIDLTIFLIVDNVKEFDECISDLLKVNKEPLSNNFPFKGKLYYSDTKNTEPEWKSFLEKVTTKQLSINNNTSNKAVLLLSVNNSIMALVFGYGRTLLKEEVIQKNFGLKVVLSIINPNKIRSINSSTIKDMVVNTQKQTPCSTSQVEFELNTYNDIIKGVTGIPSDYKYGNNISGTDSLRVTLKKDLSEIYEKLKLYYEAYNSNKYENNEFKWVNNITVVKDKLMIKRLNNNLTNEFLDDNYNAILIAPPQTTDWNNVNGFCISGINKNIDDSINYSLNIESNEYVLFIYSKAQNSKNSDYVINKLRRDKLYCVDINNEKFSISNIYNTIIYQTILEKNNYILYSSNWYRIEKLFFDKVENYIKNHIPISDLKLPNCLKNQDESDYNEMVANKNKDICLMDKKLFNVKDGPKYIESCDLLTKAQQFIHVKNMKGSNSLSHLFAQGKVSAECFLNDETYRLAVAEHANNKFGTNIFNFKDKPKTSSFEVIYAIIDKPNKTIDKLPFFSKVNLMLATEELEKMNYNYSVCFIEREQ